MSRKLIQKAWDHLSNDYKMIKNGVKYAMIDGCILEPIEIDDLKGEYRASIIFKCYEEDICPAKINCFYDPTKSQEENFEKAIKRVVHYKDYYEYFIDNKLYKILSIENKDY